MGNNVTTLLGSGAFSDSHFYGLFYDDALLSKGFNICQLEALNLVLALTNLLSASPQNYQIVVNTDNVASQQVLEAAWVGSLFYELAQDRFG